MSVDVDGTLGDALIPAINKLHDVFASVSFCSREIKREIEHGKSNDDGEKNLAAMVLVDGEWSKERNWRGLYVLFFDSTFVSHAF